MTLMGMSVTQFANALLYVHLCINIYYNEWVNEFMAYYKIESFILANWSCLTTWDHLDTKL